MQRTIAARVDGIMVKGYESLPLTLTCFSETILAKAAEKYILHQFNFSQGLTEKIQKSSFLFKSVEKKTDKFNCISSNTIACYALTSCVLCRLCCPQGICKKNKLPYFSLS